MKFDKPKHHPSAAALTLRESPNKALGVIVKNFEDPFFGHMIGEVQALAWAKHYTLILTGRVPRKGQEVDLTCLLMGHLDGVIVAGSDFEPEGLDAFTSRGIPIVQIGTGRRRKGIFRVCMDQKFGLDQLVNYLKTLGHHDIGYIGDDTPSNLRREEILRAILRSHDLAIRPNAFVRVPAQEMGTGYEAMQALCRQCGELLPSAVIAANDVIAQAALRALFEKRITVPDDLSLAGVDDIPSASMTLPALTTLRQPIPDMVSEAFQLLTGHTAKSKPRAATELVVKPELIVRESCAAPRARK